MGPRAVRSAGAGQPCHTRRPETAQLASRTPTFEEKEYYLLYFDQSVKGLRAGAPVEFRGFRMGQVLDVGMEWDAENFSINMPVLIELEPEHFRIAAGTAETDGMDPQMFVDRGFRVQLQTGNLLTGAKLVGLDFFPDAEPAVVTERRGYPVWPTAPSPRTSAPFSASSTTCPSTRSARISRRRPKGSASS
jgi:paraquat-inducible protein B